MAGIRVVDALGYSTTQLADLFTRSFEGYIVPIDVDPQLFSSLVRISTYDLALSRVALMAERPVGCLFSSIRGTTARVSGMGVVAQARRRGLGRKMLTDALDGYAQAGVSHCVLEVITANAPARELYRSLEFEVTGALVGWIRLRSALQAPEHHRDLVPLGIVEVAHRMAAWGEAALPWQLAPESVATQGPRCAGFALGERAAAVVSDPRSDRMRVLALTAVEDSARLEMLRALVQAFPDRAWSTPVAHPEGRHERTWKGAGFEEAPIRQLQMERSLLRIGAQQPEDLPEADGLDAIR